MKAPACFVVCLLLLCNIAFAEGEPNNSVSSERMQNSGKSRYKSSPKLNYGSNKPDKDDNGLGNLKPMLDQTLGNNKDGLGGGIMPNGGTYKF